jgi:hypothetical protein
MDSLVIIIVAIVALLAAAIGLVVYLRRRPEEEEDLHFQCPSCSRRLRYRAKQAGHQGACPRCRETFVFPGGAKPSKSR